MLKIGVRQKLTMATIATTTKCDNQLARLGKLAKVVEVEVEVKAQAESGRWRAEDGEQRHQCWRWGRRAEGGRQKGIGSGSRVGWEVAALLVELIPIYEG